MRRKGHFGSNPTHFRGICPPTRSSRGPSGRYEKQVRDDLCSSWRSPGMAGPDLEDGKAPLPVALHAVFGAASANANWKRVSKSCKRRQVSRGCRTALTSSPCAERR
eukprot:scaffold5816_cov267-Pinguiococcus_pyrenoidosus.AAC.14